MGNLAELTKLLCSRLPLDHDAIIFDHRQRLVAIDWIHPADIEAAAVEFLEHFINLDHVVINWNQRQLGLKRTDMLQAALGALEDKFVIPLRIKLKHAILAP